MSDIGQINSSLSPRDIEPRPVARPSTSSGRTPGREAHAPKREADRIELSPAAQARIDDGIRAEVVVRVREEIVRGVYDTPERFEAAADALIRTITSTEAD